jgi:hypothetical protein
MWLKGDIVLTVSFHRLRLLFDKWDGGRRVYDVRALDDRTFEYVKECVRAGLGLTWPLWGSRSIYRLSPVAPAIKSCSSGRCGR